MTSAQNRLTVIVIAVASCLSAYALAHAGHVVPVVVPVVAGDVAAVPQSGRASTAGETSVPPAAAVFGRGAAAADDPAPTF